MRTRRKFRNGEWIEQPFTPEEETARDAEEAEAQTPPTDAERIDAAFPQSDVARVIFEALYELTNRVRTLEGNAAITRAQLRDWLITKLPQED
jgi:hypothetical protein